MSGKTKLYQSPGSPLIGGHSKHEAPLWRAVLGGVIVGIVAIAALVGALYLAAGDWWSALSEPSASRAVLLVGAATGLVGGSALGAWVARRMGWSIPWLAAAVTGSIVAVGVAGLLFATGAA